MKPSCADEKESEQHGGAHAGIIAIKGRNGLIRTTRIRYSLMRKMNLTKGDCLKVTMTSDKKRIKEKRTLRRERSGRFLERPTEKDACQFSGSIGPPFGYLYGAKLLMMNGMEIGEVRTCKPQRLPKIVTMERGFQPSCTRLIPRSIMKIMKPRETLRRITPPRLLDSLETRGTSCAQFCFPEEHLSSVDAG